MFLIYFFKLILCLDEIDMQMEFLHFVTLPTPMNIFCTEFLFNMKFFLFSSRKMKRTFFFSSLKKSHPLWKIPFDHFSYQNSCYPLTRNKFHHFHEAFISLHALEFNLNTDEHKHEDIINKQH